MSLCTSVLDVSITRVDYSVQTPVCVGESYLSRRPGDGGGWGGVRVYVHMYVRVCV